MKIKLFTALCREEVIRFDGDGRIYKHDLTTGRYYATDTYIFYDYFGAPMYLIAPEYFRAGAYDPIEDDVKYEIFDSDNSSDVPGAAQTKYHSMSD